MQDRPTARELLDTIAELLEGDVLAATRGPLRHRVRVAANLCRIVEREVALGGAHDAREIELLAELLGVEPAGRDSRSLARELAGRLRSGHPPDLELRAWPALLEIVRGKLAIAKPGHDDYDFGDELDA